MKCIAMKYLQFIDEHVAESIFVLYQKVRKSLKIWCAFGVKISPTFFTIRSRAG